MAIGPPAMQNMVGQRPPALKSSTNSISSTAIEVIFNPSFPYRFTHMPMTALTLLEVHKLLGYAHRVLRGKVGQLGYA